MIFMQDKHALRKKALEREILASEAKANYYLTKSNLSQATRTSASIQKSHSSTTGENTQLPYNPGAVSAGPVYQSLGSHFERETTSLPMRGQKGRMTKAEETAPDEV
uniref:Uncharacterized protein n=1 Tax=Romanomermis culicivorax TaxID=13658 RepID=A0A915JLR4_ROMCU